MAALSTTSSPRELNGKRKKSVRFHRDTMLGDSDHIALTITRHSYIHDKGYTQYFIKLMCRGVEWTLHKRYRDFYELHHELIKENQNYNIDLPKLPEKRWFERQRWINRSDEKYGWIRRIQLQDYLRAVVKIRVLRNESLSFWKFVCMPKRVMIGPQTAEEAERENSRSRSRSVSADMMAGLKGVAATASSSSSIKAPIDGKASGLKGILHKAPSAEERVTQPAVEPESKQEVYDPDADLTSFNESLALAAQEAVMRGLYGSRSSKADVDNISSLTGKGEKAEPAAESHVPKANALKLNKVYDDNGEEVTGNLETAHCQDLAFIASSNARLNTRLTSKEEFALPHSSKAAIEQLHHVNKAWSATEMAAALDAINSEEFDTNLHFSGPRSGPPSLSPSPNVSVSSFSGIDLNRTDVSIMPGPPPHGIAGSTALSSSLKSSQFKMSASPSASPKVSPKVSLSSVADSSFMTPKPPAEEPQGGSAAGSVLPPNAPEKRPRPAATASSTSAAVN